MTRYEAITEMQKFINFAQQRGKMDKKAVLLVEALAFACAELQRQEDKDADTKRS